jgi:hypothetical protein
MRSQKKLEPSSKSLTQSQKYLPLQSYDDYANLVEQVINGLLKRGPLDGIDTKTAHTIGVLCGYGNNALRDARGGKLQMSVFLQDMRRINVESLSRDQITEFLQGDENTQIEVLKQITDKEGKTVVEAEVLPKKQPVPKLDTELLSNLSGIPQEDIKDVLEGDVIPDMERKEKPQHEWEQTAGKTSRYCKVCGKGVKKLSATDMESVCSLQWGLF